MLYWLLQYAGLSTKFATDGHYTVFAPNNNVFTGLAPGTVDYLRSVEVGPFPLQILFGPNIYYLVLLIYF